MEVDIYGRDRRSEHYFGPRWLQLIPMPLQPRYMAEQKLIGAPSRKRVLVMCMNHELRKMARS